MPEVWKFGNQHTVQFDWGHSAFGLKNVLRFQIKDKSTSAIIYLCCEL